MKKATIAATLAATVAAVTAAHGADIQEGKREFNKCRACHTLEAGKNRIGPTLHGLFGRKAGTVPHYAYSSAMKDSGIVWNKKTLMTYLKNPRQLVKGTKMAFPGIKDHEAREDLIAYLKKATR